MIRLFLLSGLIATNAAELQIDELTPIPGTEKWDWWQARSAYVPGPQPLWLTTMSQTGKTGAHDFHDILQSITDIASPISSNCLQIFFMARL